MFGGKLLNSALLFHYTRKDLKQHLHCSTTCPQTNHTGDALGPLIEHNALGALITSGAYMMIGHKKSEP